MVREFTGNDLDEVMSIWLKANVETHSYVHEDYWRNHYDMVREMLPEAEILVFDQEGKILGFIGMKDTYIAGIFVDETARSRGIGKKLLDAVKERKRELSLQVYKQNQRAEAFYEREGFEILREQVEEETGEAEFLMQWKA